MPVSKNGIKYAKGSSSTYGGWESKVCARCGGKVVKSTGPGYMFHFDYASQTATTVCATCLKSSVTCHTA